MCTVVAATLTMVALSAASALQSGMAAKAQVTHQADMAARDADIARQEAGIIRQNNQQEETVLRQDNARKLGTERSLLSGQGVDLGDTDSSAVNYLEQQSASNEQDALMLRQQGAHQAWMKENAAGTALARASDASARASTMGTSSLLNASRSVAGSWYSYAKR